MFQLRVWASLMGDIGMKPIAVMLLVGSIVTVASALIPSLEQFGPLFALWTAGAAHVKWILDRERKDVRRAETKLRRAA